MSGQTLLKLGWRNDSALWDDIPKEAADSIREFVSCISNSKAQNIHKDVEKVLLKSLPSFFDQRFNRPVARTGKTAFWSSLAWFGVITFRISERGYCNDEVALMAIRHEAIQASMRYNQYVCRGGQLVLG